MRNGNEEREPQIRCVQVAGKRAKKRSSAGFVFWVKRSLQGLLDNVKGLLDWLHFFEHFTCQVSQRHRQVACTVAKSGHGLYGITPKVGGVLI
jgi:hypothetical protein